MPLYLAYGSNMDTAAMAVRCPRSSEPVFVAQGGSTDLWVRVGNSTRAFGVDEAVTYVARHFKPSLGDLLRPRR